MLAPALLLVASYLDGNASRRGLQDENQVFVQDLEACIRGTRHALLHIT